MRKQFAIIEMTQLGNARLDNLAEDAMLEIRERQEQRRDGARPPIPRPVRPARPPRPVERRPDGLEIHDPERFERFTDVDVVLCHSMAEAEEYIGEVHIRYPQYKFVVFESVAFFEVVATPTIKKKWDANGQFVDV